MPEDATTQTQEPQKRTGEEVTDSIRGLATSKFFEGIVGPDTSQPKKNEPPAKKQDEPAPKPAKQEPQKDGEPQQDDPPKAGGDDAKVDEQASGDKKKVNPDIENQIRQREMAQVAAEATAKAMSQFQQPKQGDTEKQSQQPQRQQDLVDQLPEMDQEDADAYAFLAEQDPKAWGSLISDIVKFEQESQEYIKQWKKDNPGEMYNPDDEEHEELYKKEPKRPNRRQIKQAERELMRREILTDVDKTTSKEIQNIKRATNRERVEKQIKNEVKAFRDSVITGLKEAIGADSFDEKSEKAANKIINDKYPQIQPVLEAIDYMQGDAIEFNPNDPTHQEIVKAGQAIEEMLMSQPPQLTVREDGKYFATHAEYNQLDKKARAQRWVVGLPEIKAMMQDGFKRLIDSEYRDWFNIFGGTDAGAAGAAATSTGNNATPTGGTQQGVSSESSKETTRTPSIGSSTNVSGSRTSTPTQKAAPMDNFLKGLTG